MGFDFATFNSNSFQSKKKKICFLRFLFHFFKITSIVLKNSTMLIIAFSYNLCTIQETKFYNYLKKRKEKLMFSLPLCCYVYIYIFLKATYCVMLVDFFINYRFNILTLFNTYYFFLVIITFHYKKQSKKRKSII